MHGALIDAELLARVYLAMTGGQTALVLDADVKNDGTVRAEQISHVTRDDLHLVVIKASAEENAAHEALLEKIRKSGTCVWDSTSESSAQLQKRQKTV